MIRQIRLLTKLQICNLFGINEVRFTKDKKKKARFWGLSVIWALLFVFILSYVAGMSFVLVKLDAPRLVPVVLSAITCVIVFIFTFLKTGKAIFQQKAFEQQIALPVSKTAIIVSRFLTMYVTNLLFTGVVMVTGSVVYACLVKPGISFYIYGILCTILLPLLPITVATMIGVIITAISSRMKHKSLVETALTMLIVGVIIVGSMLTSDSGQVAMEDVLQDLTRMLEQQIGGMYPPALLVGNAMVSGSFLDFLLFAVISLGIFGVFLLVLQKYFLSICTALSTNAGNKSFHMTELGTSSVLKALWKKEIKRYFASTIYVTNTMIGYFLMVVFPIIFLVADLGNINIINGAESMEQTLQIEGIIRKIFPFMLAIMPSIMPTTSVSISMEGKQWWILQSLPVSKEKIIQAKVLADLTVVAPFYVVSEILAIITLRPSFLEMVWMLVVPAVYILFSAVAGIVINLHFPVFDWENETVVVKQSAATFFAMLVGAVTCGIPMGILVVLPEGFEMIYMAVVILLVLGGTGVLWKSKCVDR